MHKKTDQALVDEYIAARSETSFRELYRRQTPALYAFALRLCDSEADAQDAIQNMWMRACDGFAKFQWRSSLKTWMTGILINCVRELTRKNILNLNEPVDNHEILAPDVPHERVGLKDAIARLPNGYREVLLLHDLEGYTHEEIGSLLNINVGTSKSQLHHARQALRGLWSNHHEGI